MVDSAPSPHRFNDEEDYKPPTAIRGIIRVKGNSNFKEACEALAWDKTGDRLRITGALEGASIGPVKCTSPADECPSSIGMLQS